MEAEARFGEEAHSQPANVIATDPISSTVLDHTTDGVVVTDSSGVILYVNEPLLRLFGYGRDDLVGQSVEVLVPDYQRDDHHAHLQEFMKLPEPRPMGREDLDIEGRHANGASFPVDVQLDALPDRSMVVATVRDMTAQRQSTVDGAIVRIDLANAREQIVRLQGSLDLVIQRLFALGTSITAGESDEPVLLERLSGATRRIDEIIETVQRRRLPSSA